MPLVIRAGQLTKNRGHPQVNVNNTVFLFREASFFIIRVVLKRCRRQLASEIFFYRKVKIIHYGLFQLLSTYLEIQ